MFSHCRILPNYRLCLYSYIIQLSSFYAIETALLSTIQSFYATHLEGQKKDKNSQVLSHSTSNSLCSWVVLLVMTQSQCYGSYLDTVKKQALLLEIESSTFRQQIIRDTTTQIHHDMIVWRNRTTIFCIHICFISLSDDGPPCCP